MSKSILIVAEAEGGRLVRMVSDLAAVACGLVGGAAGSVVAALSGPPGTAGLAKELWPHGVSVAYVAEHPLLGELRPETHARAAAAAVQQAGPSLVLVGQTLLGRDMAPYLAARLNTSVLMNATELRRNSSGEVEVVCPVYGGSVRAVYTVSESPATVVGFQPGVAVRGEAVAGGARQGQVVSVDPGLGGFQSKVKLVNRATTAGPRLEEARVIVSGGKGLGDKKNYAYIEDLAKVVGGMPGASRAIVDLGWATRAQQVGLTGKRVSPDLYMAIGISGASQHMAGCSTSKVIVAVNRERDAVIFKYARYGVLGDCLEFLPSFIEECRKLKAG
ncbi:MAG: electron transfer flavoprotein subunit alpha/FixB family protein [Chloroflexi bacterium]|nr:electron transfer flavoprotein subunit alpha/FixB family protein [Chloroflexota bacterium]